MKPSTRPIALACCAVLLVFAGCWKRPDPWAAVGIKVTVPSGYEQRAVKGTTEVFDGVALLGRAPAPAAFVPTITVTAAPSNAHGGRWGNAQQHAAFDRTLMSSFPPGYQRNFQLRADTTTTVAGQPARTLVMEYDFYWPRAPNNNLRIHEHTIYLDRGARHITLQLLCDVAMAATCERDLDSLRASVQFRTP